MKRKIKVLIAFGTRPEAVKMAPVVRALESDEAFDVKTLATAQHREMLDQVVELFGLRIDYDLDIMSARQTLDQLTARILTAASPVLEQTAPDVVLVHGDTTTALALSLAAFYQQIPVGHVEAGLRSHDRYAPFPEEMNRRLISNIATWHYAPTEGNRDNLLAEDVDPSNIWVTGNTVIDGITTVVNSSYRFSNPALAQTDFDGFRVLGLTCHRRENLGVPMERIFEAVRDMVREHPDVQVVYPVHRNPAVQDAAARILGEEPRIRLIDPLDYADFSNFMARCFFMLTDSGGVQEEAPALDVPVLVLRDTTERPEALEAGCAKLIGTSYAGVRAGCEALFADQELYKRMASSPDPYGDGHAAMRIRQALHEAFDLA